MPWEPACTPLCLDVFLSMPPPCPSCFKLCRHSRYSFLTTQRCVCVCVCRVAQFTSTRNSHCAYTHTHTATCKLTRRSRYHQAPLYTSQVSPELMALLAAMLEKDPERRISLRAIMAHSWVTLEGRWPCRSIQDLRGANRKEDMLDELPGGDVLPVANHRVSMDWGSDRLVSMDFMATANVVDLPDEDWLTPVAASAEEHPLAAGEVLLRQGETGTSMFYVVEGTLEVILKLRSLGGTGKGDADETPVAELPSTIVEAALRAQDMISKRKVGKREFVVTTRGAGEFVGVMSLFSAPPVRVATVRAKTAARVRVIPLQHLLGYLSVR